MMIAEMNNWILPLSGIGLALVAAGIVFGVTYYLMDKMFAEQHKTRLLELKKAQLAEITPVKLQAYERLTLFLDRISADNIVIRITKPNQTAQQLRQGLIQTISSEYNHNISQQIYVSNDAWNMIKAVKEQMIAIIEDSYKNSEADTSGPDLGKAILTRMMAENTMPNQRAIELLKKEIEIAL
ncbi:MAG: hypothetical protein HOI49_08915 [Bacteroidetes bacterium]|jgi:hypothetical protein|nr:hypothetical protein [Bacteroidota bacterium]